MLLKEEYRGIYRKVLIVQDRAVWAARQPVLGPGDLVLTFDLGLIKDVRAAGHSSGILDHVVDPVLMHRLNYDVYGFFARWHLDAQGKDIVMHRDVAFGACFSQEIGNDIIYSARLALCFLALKGLKAESIHYGLRDPMARMLAEQYGPAGDFCDGELVNGEMYYFPVFKYMDEIVRPSGLVQKLKNGIRRSHNQAASFFQSLSGRDRHMPAAFIQTYFPTMPVIDLAEQEGKLQVYLEGYPGQWVKELRHCTLPIATVSEQHKGTAARILRDWEKRRAAELVVDGVDIGSVINRLIGERLAPRLPEYVATLETYLEYFKCRRLNVIVLIANIGMKSNILLAIGRLKKIPSFIIVNGYLSGDFDFESRNADWVNCYGRLIRKNYYHDAPHVVCLGDPRMDAYVERAKRKSPAPSLRPRIVIGAGGYDSIDLNGHLCAEFGFLDVVLEVCSRCLARGRVFDLTIKIRRNSYINQYQSFCREFFPGLTIDIVNDVPMVDVLAKADFYVATHSQTHFEAAILGVPSVYLKNYDSFIDPPYDEKSELTTVRTAEALEKCLERFFRGEPVGRAFMDRSVLEQYFGLLDGGSTRRNLDFIMKLAKEGRGD